MKTYYAIFKKTKEAVEVEFPDLQGCCTFGSDWEEAIENAKDVLAGWLAHAESKFIKNPSRHDDLKCGRGEELVPIMLDENIMASYKNLKRFNVIFPAETLKRVDDFRKKSGLKRSTLLQRAAEEYLQQHKF